MNDTNNHNTIHLDPVLRTSIENLYERHERLRSQIIAMNAEIAQQNDAAAKSHGENFATLPHEATTTAPQPKPLITVPEELTFEEIARRLLARSVDDALAAYVRQHGLHTAMASASASKSPPVIDGTWTPLG